MKKIKKIPLWVRIFGRKYFVVEVEELKNDEFFCFLHKIYVPRRSKK